MARKAKKSRRRRRAAGHPAEQGVAPQVTPAESPAESREQLPPRENYAVDVAPDRIDMDPKRLDRENPVCSLPPESDDAVAER